MILNAFGSVYWYRKATDGRILFKQPVFPPLFMSLPDMVHAILDPVRALRGECEKRISFQDALEDISALPEASLSGCVIPHRKEGLQIIPGLVEKTSVSFTGMGVQVAEHFRQVMIPAVSPSHTVTYVPAHTLDGRLSVVKVTGRNRVRYGLHGDVTDPSKQRLLGLLHEHHYHYSYEVNASFLGYAGVALPV